MFATKIKLNPWNNKFLVGKNFFVKISKKKEDFFYLVAVAVWKLLSGIIRIQNMHHFAHLNF